MELFIKCYICDAQLGADEIKHTPAYGRGNFGPCGKCNEIIENVFEPPSEEEIDEQLALELFYEEREADNQTVIEEDENSS